MAAAARGELEKAGGYEGGGEGDGEEESGGSGKHGSIWSQTGSAVVVSASLATAVVARITLSFTSALKTGIRRG